MTLSNVDALDSTTETTVETAIDTLTNLVTVGTITTGTWEGTAIADGRVADDLTIDGGAIDGSIIGGTTAAAGSFTTLKASSTVTIGAGGDEFTISESSDDITFKNTKADKDIIFNVLDGSSDTT